VDAARARDPLELQGARLPEAMRARIDAEIEELLTQAVSFATGSPHPDPDSALDYLYADGTRTRSGVG
jgi:pyruvate dehydrogenase E1 component alpha subunit